MTARRDVTHPPERQLLKAVAKSLVRAAGGVEAAALATTRSPSQLSAYGHVNAPEFMPVDVIADLEAVTHGTAGHPLATRHLARLAEFALVALPDAPDGSTDWHRSLGALAREVGDIIERVGSALANDGAVSAAEVRDARIVEECDELIAHAIAMRALALRVLEAG